MVLRYLMHTHRHWGRHCLAWTLRLHRRLVISKLLGSSKTGFTGKCSRGILVVQAKWGRRFWESCTGRLEVLLLRGQALVPHQILLVAV